MQLVAIVRIFYYFTKAVNGRSKRGLSFLQCLLKVRGFLLRRRKLPTGSLYNLMHGMRFFSANRSPSIAKEGPYVFF